MDNEWQPCLGPSESWCKAQIVGFVKQWLITSMKNVQNLTYYSDPLIRKIAEKQIRWAIGNS